MPNRAHLINNRYGQIIVQHFSHVEKGNAFWIGLCDCGNTTRPIATSALKRGNTTSCGCKKKNVCSQKAMDITGQTFGKLTVIQSTKERSYDGRVIWECLCSCGNSFTTSIKNLLSRDTVSCGCYRKEIARITSSQRYDVIAKK